MKSLFVVLGFVSTLTLSSLSARGMEHGAMEGGAGFGGGAGYNRGDNGVGVGAGVGVGGVGAVNAGVGGANGANARAFNRGLEAGTLDAGGGTDYGAYPYQEENYNPFPDDAPGAIDNGTQIYNEDETGYKGPYGGNPNNPN